MRKTLLLFLAVVFAFGTVAAKRNDEGLVPDYQITGAGMTSDNARQVVVSIMSKKKDVTDAELAAAAVHGVLFRDYDDATNSGYGSVASQKSIMCSPSAEAQHIDFFEPFFRNGDAVKYVQIVGDSRRVVKSGKLFKISATVRVNASALRKDLQKQGFIKGLGSGW